jgi:hypothetical protein
MSDVSDQTRLGSHGGKRTPGQQGDNVTLRSRGNSRDYLIARLRRDGRDDLVEAIEARKISAFAAAVVAGYRRRAPTLSAGDHNKSRKLAFDIRALIG